VDSDIQSKSEIAHSVAH